MQRRGAVSVQLYRAEWSDQEFFLSFTTPGYLGSGATPSLPAFTPTDGTNTWTFTKGLVGFANPVLGCFMFGTSSSDLGPAPSNLTGDRCAVRIGSAGFQAGFAVFTQGGLPTAVGTYPQLEFGGGFGTATGAGTLSNFSNATGSMTLVISDTTVSVKPACGGSGISCNVLYEFAYTAITGTVKSFSFSFTSPTYLQAGQTPIVTEFTPTDGSNHWTLTRGIVAVASPDTPYVQGCFLFGTPFAGLTTVSFFGSCGIAASLLRVLVMR